MKETVFAYAEIKHLFKTKYELDIVITQTGQFFELIEEDAATAADEFGWTLLVRDGSYDSCKVPATQIMEDFLVRKLTRLGFNYAILRLVASEEGFVTREVVKTTRTDIVGLKVIITNISHELAESRKLFLEAILDGVDPQTGELLQDDSVWKHPKIIKDIKDFLDK